MTLHPLLRLGLPLLPALLPLVVVLLGTRGPRELVLNFGPGDGPYTHGFGFPNPVSFDPYEIRDGVATHWTTHDATVELPLVVQAPALRLSLRFARHFADRGHVDLYLAGREAERLVVRKGYQEYHVTSAVAAETKLRLRLHVEARDDRNLGLSLDWLRVTLPAASRLWLTGTARWRAPALVAIVAVLLILLGFSFGAALALTAPLALLAAFGLLKDPWLVHRMLTGLPEALVLLGGGALLARWAMARGVLGSEVRFASALVLVTFLGRALLVNHPDFYYPDFTIHTRLAKLLARDGLATLLTPAAFGASFQEARHSVVGMPYSWAFHVPFALLDWPYDRTLSTMKVLGAFLSAIPIALGFALARQLGLPGRAAAVLLALAPTYPHWLSRANLPALLGHNMDLVLLLWLACHLPRVASARLILAGAGVVAATQLTYSFNVLVSGLLLPLLATLTFVAPEDDRGRRAGTMLAIGALGALASFLLYYRDFLAGTLTLLRSAGATDVSAEGGFATRLLEVLRTGLDRFFDTLWPVLALLGAALLPARLPATGRSLLGAWLLSWLSLTLLRAAMPGFLQWNHELLLLTPLLAVAAATTLTRLAASGGARRVIAGLALLGLGGQGLAFAWSSYAGLLGLVR